MRPQIEVHVPSRMAAEMAELCQDIRQSKPSIYGELLRENILEVLKCSFPRFGALLTRESLDEIAAHFLARHGSTRPQFHHIATEFIEFAQHDLALPKPHICLLEYEWILLATEISPAQVIAPLVCDDEDLATAKISLNPTCEVVAMPFDITQPDVPAELDGSEKNYVYAVYRTAQHSVLTRSLTYLEFCLIDPIRHEEEMDLNALVSASATQLSADAVRQWVIQETQSGLIVLKNEYRGSTR